jgi:hypothetical protein
MPRTSDLDPSSEEIDIAEKPGSIPAVSFPALCFESSNGRFFVSGIHHGG